jgi:hypothetical protein
MKKEKIIKEWKHPYSIPGDRIIIGNEPSDFYNQPFVVKKRERALEVIRKCGIPKFD